MSGISKIVTIMKKIMKPFVLVAAAAMALASCQKNEIPAPEKQDVHFTINAGIETKTSIVETLEDGKTIYKAQWDGNEELGVLFAAPNAGTIATDVVTLTNAESGRTASFQGNVTLDESSGTFYAFYPATAFYRGYEEGDARLDLKNTQKPTATSFDPSCDILVAKPYDYTVEEGAVVADGLEFARLMSVLRIDLMSEFAEVQDEFVESVSFTAGDVKITGYARIFLENPVFTGNWASSGEQWCTVTANYDSDLVSINGTSNSVYLVIAPVTIPANKDLTFEIKTKNYNISKTFKSPEMKFTAGKVSKINLTIAADDCEKIDTSIDYSGEYLIAGKEGDKWYAAKKYTSGNYLAVSEIEFIDENIVETEAISDHYMTITKVVGGDYDGMYTIVDAGGKYLATSSSGDNYMKAESSASANTYWTIVKDEAKGTYSIVASKSDYTRNDMRFNYNSGTNSRVSCYDGTKTALPYLSLFSTSLVKPDPTPKLELGEESIELTAAGGKGTIDVTAKNLPADIQVRALTAEGAQDEVEWLTAEYADETITYTAAANESTEARTAYIEVYVSDDLKTGVSVTQAAKAAEGAAYYEKVTSAPADWSGNYLIVFGSSAHATNTNNKDLIATTSVSITDNKIVATDALAGAVMTVTKSGDNYHMTYPDGKYFGMAKNASTAVTSAFDLTFIYTDSGVKISGVVSGTTYILYSNSGNYFRCYTDKTGTSGYTLPTLYKLSGNSEGEGGETPEPELQERNLAFSSNTATATVGQAFTAPTLSGVTTGVTYSSSNPAVATVNASGVVTLVGAGTTTITATAPATDQYEAGEASYTLTVNPADEGGDDEQGNDPVTVTKSMSSYGFSNEQKVTEIQLDDVITANVVGSANTGKYYTNGSNWRLYQTENATLTISAKDGYVINSVKVTYSVSNSGILKKGDTQIITGTTDTVNATSVTYSVGNSGSATNGQVRVTAIEVVYQKN